MITAAYNVYLIRTKNVLFHSRDRERVSYPSKYDGTNTVQSSDVWQVPQQYCCCVPVTFQGDWTILNKNLETSRELMIRCLIRYWKRALDIISGHQSEGMLLNLVFWTWYSKGSILSVQSSCSQIQCNSLMRRPQLSPKWSRCLILCIASLNITTREELHIFSIFRQ